ncbi:hypothetical protein IAR50_005563 [Cryptococcus sp. DSM 104548]
MMMSPPLLVTTRSTPPKAIIDVSVSHNEKRFPPLQLAAPVTLRSARPGGGDTQRRRDAVRKHAFTVYGSVESDQRGSVEAAEGLGTSKPLPRLPSTYINTQFVSPQATHSRSPSCSSHPFAVSNSSRTSLIISPLSGWHTGIPDTPPEGWFDSLGDWFEREEKRVLLQQSPSEELFTEDKSLDSRLATPPKPIHLPPTPPSAEAAKSPAAKPVCSHKESRSSLSSSLGSIIPNTRDRPPTLMDPLAIGGWGREWERGFSHKKFNESVESSSTGEDDSRSTMSSESSMPSPAPSSLLERRMSESLSLASPAYSPTSLPHPFGQRRMRLRDPPTPYERNKKFSKRMNESWLDFSEDAEDARAWDDDEVTVKGGSSRWSAVFSEVDLDSNAISSETESRPTEASQIRDAYLASILSRLSD